MSPRRSSAAEQTPDQRAKDLLREVLAHAEQAHFVATGEVVITGSEGGRYRIFLSSHVGNIEVLSNVKLMTVANTFLASDLQGRRLCAHLQRGVDVPMFDHFVAQVLAIKSDEKKFVRTCYIYA